MLFRSSGTALDSGEAAIGAAAFRLESGARGPQDATAKSASGAQQKAKRLCTMRPSVPEAPLAREKNREALVYP